MSPRLLLSTLVALAATSAPTATGHATLSWPMPATAQAAATPAAPSDPLLPRVRSAIEAAESGAFDATQYADIAGHALYPWVEYAALRRDIDTVPAERGGAFLQRHAGTAAGEAFREIWVAASARRKDWPAVLAAWKPALGAKSADLRCAQLQARLATGASDAQWIEDAKSAWRSSGKPLPGACDPVFDALTTKGALTPDPW